MSARRAASAALLSLIALVAVPAAAAATTGQDDAPVAGYTPEPAQVTAAPATQDDAVGAYDGDPENEAMLVALEERRLIDIQLVAAGVLVPELDTTRPFRVTDSAVSTLVLPARESAYTLQEIANLSPATLESPGNGDFLLRESLAVMEGATLDIRARGAFTLRLASSAEGFASIMSLGGTVKIVGADAAPAQITSWDPDLESPDLALGDGRAYIRALGGAFIMDQARVADLGFWSGVTGGIALTGLEETLGMGLGSGEAVADVAQAVEPGAAGAAGAASGGSDPAGVDPSGVDGTEQASARDALSPEAQAQWDQMLADLAASAGVAPEDVTRILEDTTSRLAADLEAAAAGETGVATTDLDGIQEASAEDFATDGVTASITASTIVGNAFGLFVANSERVEVRDSSVTDNLVHGIVMHREVERATVTNTVASRNAGDGIRISRGSSGVTLEDVTADLNSGSGISIDASPLASGPSAVGLSPAAYGGHVVRGAALTDNAEQGLVIKGGDGITVSDATVTGSRFGIVVAEGAQGVSIEDSVIESPEQQGVALRDGVQAAVTGNTITDTRIGIYLRDSVATVTNNQLTGIRGHGVTVVGQGAGTVIETNAIAGVGSSAVDLARAEGVEVDRNANEVSEWRLHSAWEQFFRALTRPLTLMWILLAAVLVFTALAGLRRGPRQVGVSPYDGAAPLSSLTRGLADPATVPGTVDAVAMAPSTGEKLPRRVAGQGSDGSEPDDVRGGRELASSRA